MLTEPNTLHSMREMSRHFCSSFSFSFSDESFATSRYFISLVCPGAWMKESVLSTLVNDLYFPSAAFFWRVPCPFHTFPHGLITTIHFSLVSHLRSRPIEHSWRNFSVLQSLYICNSMSSIATSSSSQLVIRLNGPFNLLESSCKAICLKEPPKEAYFCFWRVMHISY